MSTKSYARQSHESVYHCLQSVSDLGFELDGILGDSIEMAFTQKFLRDAQHVTASAKKNIIKIEAFNALIM